MIVTTSSSEKIYLEGNPFHSGGEGELYRVLKPLKYKGSCVKIYFSQYQDKRREEKLKYMIVNKPLQSHIGTDFKVCWAEDLIYFNGNFVGFIMPFAFPNSIQLYELCTSKIKSRVPKVFHDKFDRKKPELLVNRLKVCVNIAIAIHCIHETSKYVFVDLKPQNILIDTSGKISIVDLDSLQVAVNGNIIHHGHVATPEYTPLEAKSLNPSINFIPLPWDYFSLAIIFYELIFGLHPYVATSLPPYEKNTTIQDSIRNELFVFGKRSKFLSPPKQHDNFKLLPSKIKKAFIDAFDVGNHSPLLRPSAQIWGKILVEEVYKESETIEIGCPICKSKRGISRHRTIKFQCSNCDCMVEVRKGKVFGYSRDKVNYVDRVVYQDKEVIAKQGEGIWKASTAVFALLCLILYGYYSSELKAITQENESVYFLKNQISDLNIINSGLVSDKELLELENEKLKLEKDRLGNEVKLFREKASLNLNFANRIIATTLNMRSDDNSFGAYKSFNKKDLKYLYTRMWIEFPKDIDQNFPKELVFYVKYFDKNGLLSRGKGSPPEYSFFVKREISRSTQYIDVGGWGNEAGGTFKEGVNTVEIWLNGKMLISSLFNIY